MKLFEDFPPVTTEQWEELIKADLKGADYNKKLVWNTIEGIPVRPYYRGEHLSELKHLDMQPGEFPYLRGNRPASNNWQVRQDIIADDPAGANSKALDALMKGAGSIGFIFNDNVEFTADLVSTLLKDICLASAGINFRSSGDCSNLPNLLDKENISRGGALTDLKGSVEYDPIGVMLTKGSLRDGEKRAFGVAASLVSYGSRIPSFKVINVDGSVFHNAGGSAVQELAFALSSAAVYMERLVAEGISASQTAGKIKFTFAAGSNYFMEIAKFRAARYLWSKIIEAWDLDPAIAGSLHIHAVTSDWNKTIYDPYVNMLRSTTESMSAVLGGADSLTVKPFDASFNANSSPFAERIARNTQLVLKEESYFDKVVDPAAGSWYIESLTGSLIDGAWKLFLETDERGGLLRAFEDGFVQKLVGETAAERDRLIALRREILVGTNQYPNPDEQVSESMDILPENSVNVAGDQGKAAPLKIYRGAEPFERIRMRTGEHPGGRPKVFLLTFGNLTMRKARAGFISGFFGCAGFEVIDNAGFEDPREGARTALDSGAPIVVACSSDEEYPDAVPAIADEIGNNAILVVAGNPKDADMLKEAGVKHFIHLRSNILEVLQQFQDELGIG